MRTSEVAMAYVALLFILCMTGCNEPPVRDTQSGKPAPRPAPDAKTGLPTRVEPVTIPCAGKGYTAKYSAQTQSMPATVDVTFRGVAPTSDAAERALERCLQVVADTKFVTTEVMGTVWYSKSGRESDDDTVTLKDGSSHLLYQPDGKRIITWNQRDGEQPSTIEENVAGGYFVKTETNKILVAPGGTFVHLSVVFKNEPTERNAFEILIAEVKNTVAKQTSPLATTGFAQVGRRDNPAAWRQVRGADGHFIQVEFDPKRGDQLVSGTGRLLGPSGRVGR